VPTSRRKSTDESLSWKKLDTRDERSIRCGSSDISERLRNVGEFFLQRERACYWLVEPHVADAIDVSKLVLRPVILARILPRTL
jgi:hypothetical protein